MDDLKLSLEELRAESESGRLASGQISPTRRAPRRGPASLAFTAPAVALVAIVAYLLVRSRTGTESPVKDISFIQLTDLAGPKSFPSLSPDGRSFVYTASTSGNWDIYLQRVGGKNPINLTKDSSADDTQPAFSPDGDQIAFRSERNGGGIFVMGATGESVRRLTDFGYNPAWSPEDRKS